MFELKPTEQVFYPAPLNEDEINPVIITSKRLIQFSPQGKPTEVEIGKLNYVGKASKRPLLFVGLVLLGIGLPGLIYGLYLWISVHGMPTFEEQPPPPDQAETAEDPFKVRVMAVIFGAVGLLFCAGGVLAGKKQRFTVVAKAEKKKPFRLPVKDKQAQTQVMMTLQSAMASAKTQEKAAAASKAAAAAAAAAAAPPAKAPAKK
jgi:hypothetical protein